MFTGFRLSLGIAWLVIVAAEMLTGAPGVGGFLWQEYNALIYAHIILCILTIGLVGFVLDRLDERRSKRALRRRLRTATPWPVLELQNVSQELRRRRPHADVLRDINLEVERGRVRRHRRLLGRRQDDARSR